jgi:hypothetical protein
MSGGSSGITGMCWLIVVCGGSLWDVLALVGCVGSCGMWWLLWDVVALVVCGGSMWDVVAHCGR